MTNNHDDLVLGIAGNSPGYLAQTGEIKAFTTAQIEQQGPKALFPIFVKGHSDFLATAPFCDRLLQLPVSSEAMTQMEPELAVRFSVTHRQDGLVAELSPFAVTLINDATHRNRSVTKLAEKKNWGKKSKGLARSQIAIESLQIGGDLEHYRICGFLRRDNKWQQCSQDVSLSQYTVFNQELCDWLQGRINQQQDESALHNITEMLSAAGNPVSITVAIGAPSYTDECSDHWLQHGDQTVVCLYDQRRYQFNDIKGQISRPELDETDCEHKLVLRQNVIAGHDE